MILPNVIDWPSDRDDALHAERHAEYDAALSGKLFGEFVDDAVDVLVISFIVAIGECALTRRDGGAVHIDGDRDDLRRAHAHADGHMGLRRELIDLRLAPAGGFLHPAFPDESVCFQCPQILCDGGQAQPQFVFEHLLGGRAMAVDECRHGFAVGLFD